MAKAEECEFLADGQCKALAKEGTMARDESCLNSNKSACCYQCARRISCEMSCDYLDDPKTCTDTGTTSPQAGDCPKCGGEMIEGMTTNYVRILKQGDLSGDLVAAFYCRECGFVEFYKKASSKEPWRWKRQSEEKSKKSEQEPQEKEPSSETTTRKMVR